MLAFSVYHGTFVVKDGVLIPYGEVVGYISDYDKRQNPSYKALIQNRLLMFFCIRADIKIL